MMKRLPSQQSNSQIHRERDARVLSRLALLLFCGLVLAGGFVFAARQHFAAVQYGYQSESLRQERERLLAERQQLLLKREQAITPMQLEAAARKLGLRSLLPGQVGTAKARTQSQQPLAQNHDSAQASFQH